MNQIEDHAGINEIAIEGEDHWHELRRRHVGASEVAALFDRSPYMSRYQLWHIKAGNLSPPNLSDDIRVQCGLALESGIAEIHRRIHGLPIDECHTYHSDTANGLGASLDFRLAGAPVEVKNIDAAAWWSGWLLPTDISVTEIVEAIEPPLHISLQLQAQMAATGADHGFIAVLVGGNRPYLIRQKRLPTVIAEIRRRAGLFWQSVADEQPPAPSAPHDEPIVRQIYAGVPAVEIPAERIGDFDAACGALIAARGASKSAGATEAAAKMAVIQLLGGKGDARGDQYRAKWNKQLTVTELKK